MRALPIPKSFLTAFVMLGADLAQIRSFGDHHYFTRDDVTELLDRAKLMKAELVTTAKDFVRLMGMGEHQERLAKETGVVSVDLVFDSTADAERIIEKTLSNFDARMLASEEHPDMSDAQANNPEA